jgi:hypothetical protein
MAGTRRLGGHCDQIPRVITLLKSSRPFCAVSISRYRQLDLENSGVDIVTVKELLGHSSISVTMRYAHTNIESKRAAVEKLDSFGDNLVTVSPKVQQSRAVLSLNRTPSYNVSKS